LVLGPSVPRNLSLTVQSAAAIKVTWSIPQSLHGPLDDLRYHVVYYPKSPNFTNENDIAHDTTENTQKYNLVDLEPDVRYSIRVSASRQRNDGTKLTSNEVAASARTFQLGTYNNKYNTMINNRIQFPMFIMSFLSIFL
jgi:hypothetical protein